jgi:murein DD-endopeptidase
MSTHRRGTVYGVLLPLLLSCVCLAQDLGRGAGLPLLVEVPTPPIPVPANEKFILVYELHLTNTGSKPVSLLRAEVKTISGTLTVLDGEPLAKAIKPTGVDSREVLTLGPGLHTVVMLWVALDRVPAAVGHAIQGTVGADSTPLLVEHRSVTIAGAPVRLGAPLRGDRWVAANGPSNDTHHRRSWLSFGGRALVPERFAIDFVRASTEGNLTTGDPALNESYSGYGAEAIAVADARIAAVKDGFPDNVPANKFPTVPSTLETMGGNYIALDLGQGRHAFYAHLQPGSLRVKVGDRVRLGQILARVGNSGNSNAPHLHFQVSDRPSLLLSDGVPYVFDSFFAEGRQRKGEIPLQNWNVRFP